MKKTELAWAAGFFDGEGTCCLAPDKPNVQIQVSQVELRTLKRFHEALGLGNITGPYGPYRTSRKNARPIFMWSCYGANTKRAMYLLWPYLSKPKKRQYIAALVGGRTT